VSTEALDTDVRVAEHDDAWLDWRRAEVEFFEQHWRDIVTSRTPKVSEYLESERRLCDRILDRCGYRGVIEAGCADGSLLMPGIVARGLDYLGIDLAPGAVTLARQSLARHALARQAVGLTPAGGHTAVIHDDIRDLPKLPTDLLPAAPLLVAYPFNVLAGIPQPRNALRAAASCGGDILLFAYQTSSAALIARRDYYRACGFTGEFRQDDRGVHFTAGLFTSSVYRPTLVVAWLAEMGYHVEMEAFAGVGLAYHARLDRP
jgi:hypothetical protein